MRKVFHIAFLWTAGLILLAHSVIPHLHHASAKAHVECGETSAESEGLIDFLARAFHNDPGTEHLEHFQIQKRSSSDLAIVSYGIPEPVISLRNEPVSICSPAVCSGCIPSVSDGFDRSRTLRGPPQV